MKRVIVYKPQKSPTQSGLKKSSCWILESSNRSDYETDPLTGWKGKNNQDFYIKLKFNSKEEALAYATKNKLQARVVTDKSKTIKIKSYADNFRFNRIKTEL